MPATSPRFPRLDRLRLAAAVLAVAALTTVPRAEDDAAPRPVPPASTDATTSTPSPAPLAGPAAISVEEHHERRVRLAGAAGPDAVVLILSRRAEKGFLGRRRSDEFFYLCPFEATDAAIVLSTEDGTVRHRVYVPPRRAALERWNGATIGPGAETARTFGFDEALPADRLEPDLARILHERSTLLVSGAAPASGRDRMKGIVDRLAAAFPESHPIHRTPGAAVPDDVPGVRVLPAGPLITDLRATKSPAEIACVRHAVAATVEGLHEAARAIAPGVAEYQVEALIELRCRLAGCLRQAFESIVGSGPNSCVLHYVDNVRTMRSGELVVVDVGGEYRGYAADVTRTFPVSGTFTERQAEIYDAVLAAQRAGIAAVAPGVTLRDVHEAAREVLREHGLDRWFIHGTSHSVGLNVHDAWGRGRELQVGSILTVEPGVYISDEALGVRIEDTVLVTEDGAEILSAGIPKDRADVEALMREPPPLELPPPPR